RELGLSLKQIQRAIDGNAREVNDIVRERLSQLEDRVRIDISQMRQLLAFLDTNDTDDELASENIYSGQSVRIGAVYSLTGLGRPYGVSSRNAILLAQHMINASDGINGAQLSVEIVDDGTDKCQASDATRNLIVEKNVVGLLGPGISHLAVSAH